MIESKKNLIWIIISLLSMYISFIFREMNSVYFFIAAFVFFIILYFKDKRCENMALDTISQLYAKNKQINIKELDEKRNCGFTQNDLKFLNYYKRKGLIPFDAELIDPDGWSPHTFE